MLKLRIRKTIWISLRVTDWLGRHGLGDGEPPPSSAPPCGCVHRYSQPAHSA